MTVKKKILAVTTAVSILFLTTASTKKEKKFNFVINKGKITYSGGNIYLGSKYKIEHFTGAEEGDVLVIDERNATDPNCEIVNSNSIHDLNIREEIIEALLCYEEKYPSKWDRTKESMMLEWFCHNVMSIFNYKPHRTNDVDFNNADEKTYRLKIF